MGSIELQLNFAGLRPQIGSICLRHFNMPRCAKLSSFECLQEANVLRLGAGRKACVVDAACVAPEVSAELMPVSCARGSLCRRSEAKVLCLHETIAILREAWSRMKRCVHIWASKWTRPWFNSAVSHSTLERFHERPFVNCTFEAQESAARAQTREQHSANT